MHGETPEFKRCCFCLPLRRGLIAWGYIKLILNTLTIAYFLITTIWLYPYFRTGNIVVFKIFITSLLIDLLFHILFIVAGHKKNIKVLKVVYIYYMVWLALVFLANCYLLYANIHRIFRRWEYIENYLMYAFLDCFFIMGLAGSVLFLQIYLILLIRSEMAKLREQTLEMQFSNHLATGEPQCTLHNHNASDADQCEGKSRKSDACTNEKQIV